MRNFVDKKKEFLDRKGFYWLKKTILLVKKGDFCWIKSVRAHSYSILSSNNLFKYFVEEYYLHVYSINEIFFDEIVLRVHTSVFFFDEIFFEERFVEEKHWSMNGPWSTNRFLMRKAKQKTGKTKKWSSKMLEEDDRMQSLWICKNPKFYIFC